MVGLFMCNYRQVEARGVLSSLVGSRSKMSALMIQECIHVLPGTPLVKRLPLQDYGLYTEVCLIHTYKAINKQCERSTV